MSAGSSRWGAGSKMNAACDGPAKGWRGCVSTTTQLTPGSPKAVEAEEILQRELVVFELNEAQRRLGEELMLELQVGR